MPDIARTLEQEWRSVNSNSAMMEHFRKLSAAIDTLRANELLRQRDHAEVLGQVQALKKARANKVEPQ